MSLLHQQVSCCSRFAPAEFVLGLEIRPNQVSPALVQADGLNHQSRLKNNPAGSNTLFLSHGHEYSDGQARWHWPTRVLSRGCPSKRFSQQTQRGSKADEVVDPEGIGGLRCPRLLSASQGWVIIVS